MKKVTFLGTALIAVSLVAGLAAQAAAPTGEEMAVSWGEPKSPVKIFELGDINYRLAGTSSIKSVYWVVEIDFTDPSGKPVTWRNGAAPTQAIVLMGASGVISMSKAAASSPAPASIIGTLADLSGLRGSGKLRLAFFATPYSRRSPVVQQPVSNWVEAPIQLLQ